MESTKRSELRKSRIKMARGWEASGMTQAGYCRSLGVSVSLFKYWRREFFGHAPKESQLTDTSKQPASKFIALKTEPQADDFSQIRITYPNGVVISVPSSMNVDHIAALGTN